MKVRMNTNDADSKDDAIQRAEDVRPRRASAASTPMREAIQQRAAPTSPSAPDFEREAEDEGIPFQRAAAARLSLEAPQVNRSLIDWTIRERRGFMFGAAVWTLVGMALVTLAAMNANVHLALASVAPMTIALMLVLLRRRPFTCHVDEDQLIFERPKLTLPLAAVEQLIAGVARKEAFVICHAGGFVAVPTNLSIPWQAFRAFLRDNLQPQIVRPRLLARLQKYYDRNAAMFGNRQVHAFWARDEQTLTKSDGRTVLAITLGLLAAAAIWIAVGFNGRAYEGWRIAGGVLGIGSLILAGLHKAHSRQGMPDKKESRNVGLVVGPAGLALVQGELVGELRWEEVRKIANRGKSASFTLDSRGTQPCIRLDVAGASIMVFDLYHRPLFHIHELIESLWHDAKR
jgi:hypothetical protein